MLSEWECKKRWKCPSDRELTLRAKLNVGWSNHTANVFLKTKAIPLNEMQAIEKVIQRANDLERLEVERVGRMVYKLENMTRNALGDGEKTCSMCGTTFGIFRSSFVHCADCGKAVCEKCRVDTVSASLDLCMLCKICSENREVWKKSGGWFYGKLPTMTEAYQEKRVSQTSGSPSPVRAFDTWSHRAPDIVRLESYEPPEENHNDHSQYTSWTMNSTTDKTVLLIPSSLENSDLSEEDQSDHPQHNNGSVNSIPDIHCYENLKFAEKQSLNTQSELDLKMNSIPDLHLLTDRNTPPFIELESFRKRSLEQKQLELNYLSVQNTKLSVSCPSLADFQEPCKLRRKASIRRKRTSDPIREKVREK